MKREGKRPKGLKPRYLGIIFILAVILPSILLAVLSIRATGREEAYIEKQIQTALLATVTHTALAADSEVKKAAEELQEGLEVPASGDFTRALSRWKASNPLVGVPFLLTARLNVIWPSSSAPEGSPERLFLQENAGFLSGGTPATLYRNIAVVYKDEILAESRKIAADKAASSKAEDTGPAQTAASSPAQKRSEQAPAAQTETSKLALAPAAAPASAAQAAPQTGRAAAAFGSTASAERGAPAADEKAVLADTEAKTLPVTTADEAPLALSSGYAPPAASKPSVAAAAAPEEPAANKPSAAPAAVPEEPSTAAADVLKQSPSADVIESQQAMNAFQESETIREKVYQQAKEKGTEVATRNVIPQAQNASPVEQTRQSQLVTETGTFAGIISGQQFGIVPRFLADRLTFIFWARLPDGRIAGCGINGDAFRARIAGVVTEGWSETRILAILDEQGNPLVVPSMAGSPDWRRPFVSREIGELLPRWEAASYLTDPGIISSQARASSLVIWILVLILFVSVSGGGTLVLRSLAGEVRLARSKATFVTNVSHELKTPLTSIGLFVELLRKGRRKDPGTTERYLSQISAETERLTRLINNVLDFSAMDRGTKKYVRSSLDAAGLCRGILEGQRVRLEQGGFTVGFVSREEPIVITADGEAIAQAVLNLISNAEKYSPVSKEIEVEVERQAAHVLIHVRDRGTGVPERLREKIFQEFYRVDDSLTTRVKGTGLGLTIARRIIRDHGGDISCAGRPGGGSDFIIRLPEEEME